MEQPIEAMSDAPSPRNKENEEDSALLGRTDPEWGQFGASLGVISLFIIGGIHWDDCEVIPTLNDYVVTFAAVDLILAVVKFVFRTDKLKKEGGPMWPWVHVESFLAISLIGVSIWGAALTFGNFDKMGTGPGECNTTIFIAAFVSVVITFVIFVAIFVYIAYLVALESRKEKKNEEVTPSEAIHDDEAQPTSTVSEDHDEHTQVKLGVL